MSEKPKPQVFYVQDPFTEEVHGPLSASDLKQRFFGGLLDGWGVSKSTTGPWTPASQVKGLRRPTAPSPESDTTAKSTVKSNTSLSGGGSVGKSTATATNDSSAALGCFAKMLVGGCLLLAIGVVLAVAYNRPLRSVVNTMNDQQFEMFIVGIIVIGSIGSLIGAVFLRAATKWVQELEVGFGDAYVTVLLSVLASVIFGVFVQCVGYAVGAATHSMVVVNVVVVLLNIIVGFLIQSGIISSRLQIPFGRGCRIVIAMSVIVITIVWALFIVRVLFPFVPYKAELWDILISWDPPNVSIKVGLVALLAALIYLMSPEEVQGK